MESGAAAKLLTNSFSLHMLCQAGEESSYAAVPKSCYGMIIDIDVDFASLRSACHALEPAPPANAVPQPSMYPFPENPKGVSCTVQPVADISSVTLHLPYHGVAFPGTYTPPD